MRAENSFDLPDDSSRHVDLVGWIVVQRGSKSTWEPRALPPSGIIEDASGSSARVIERNGRRSLERVRGLVRHDHEPRGRWDCGLARVGCELLLLCDDVLVPPPAPVVVDGFVQGASFYRSWKRLPLVFCGRPGVGKRAVIRHLVRDRDRDAAYVEIEGAALASSPIEDASARLAEAVERARDGVLVVHDVDRVQASARACLASVAKSFERGRVRAWRGLHCTATDRAALTGVTGECFATLAALPSAHERRDELPLLARIALQRVSPLLEPSVDLVEACSFPWRRELAGMFEALAAAGRRAIAVGSHVVEHAHLRVAWSREGLDPLPDESRA